MVRVILSICTLLAVLFCTNTWALELKTASQLGSEPKFILNNDGTVGGLEIEIMEAMSKVDPEITFVGTDNFMPLKRIRHDLEHGKIDVFFGYAYNEERAVKSTFVHPPLYMNQYRLAMRADDPIDPRNYDEIRALGSQGLILGLHGTHKINLLEKREKLLVYQGGKTLESVLKMLLHDRGRFAMYHTLGMVYTIREMGFADRIRLGENVLGEAGHHIVFSRTTPIEVIEKVKAALIEMKANGTMQRIVDKYTKLH